MQASATYQEILTQVAAWQDALHAVSAKQADVQRLWQAGAYDSIVVTGCGSTHYLSMIAANLLQTHTGVAARAVPAAELLFNPESIYLRRGRTLLVAISRSALTSETIQAAQQFVDQQRGEVVVISCYGDRPLNQPAALNLFAEQGQEESVAQTRSFSAMLVMAEQLAVLLGEGALRASLLTGAGQAWVENALLIAHPFADPKRFQRYFYLGSGARYGLACEAMLKMKEMSLTHAEAFHTLEFRHGPKSMVDAETVVVGLLSENAASAERAVLDEMKALGATTFTIGTQAESDYRLPEASSLVYALPILQSLAYHRATLKGLDPDRPRNLDQVVQLSALG